MKTIKIGKPYRKHKCTKCKSVYLYHIREVKTWYSDLVHCPICDDYLDFHFFDKKISVEKYNSLKGNDYEKENKEIDT